LWLQIKLDAAVAWSQQQLRERDAEINRLQRELKVLTKLPTVFVHDQTASCEKVTADYWGYSSLPKFYVNSEAS